MIEKMRYELLSHNFSLNKDLNNLNKKRLPIVAWAVSATWLITQETSRP